MSRSHDRRRSSISVYPYRLSHLPWDEAPVSASSDNLPSEPKIEITLATDTTGSNHLKPTRPARHPCRPTPLRIVSNSSSPSFDSSLNTDDSLSSISPISGQPKDPSERVVWRSPSSAPSLPSFQNGFLDRIPKQAVIDDDAASTSSSTTSRLPSVLPLCSYKRPFLGSNHDPSDGMCRSLPTRLPLHELLSTNTVIPAAGDTSLRNNLVNLTADGKKAVLSPLSFMRMRTASETSFSPPVTASTLTSESVLSFTMDENPLAADATCETDSAPAKGKRALLWKLKNRSKVQVNLDSYEEEEEALPEPRPGFFVIPPNASSIPELGAAPLSALRVEIKPEQEEEEEDTEEEDTNAKAGERGFDVALYRTRGVIRQVWRRLVGGQ